jgi:serine/threonine protein kinase
MTPSALNPDYSNTIPLEKDEYGNVIFPTWVLHPRGTKLLDWGGSGHIFYWPGNTTEVMKLPTTDRGSIWDIEIEKRVYKRLGSHPNILPCLRIAETGIDSVGAEHIVLKRAEHGTIRQYFLDGGTATVDERIKWCLDIAKAVEYVHRHYIRHGDICGRNILLDSSRTVLLFDFAGSGIDGDPPRAHRAEPGFMHPIIEFNWNGMMEAELHALGSTIYEIMTTKRPHYELQDWMVNWIRKYHPGVADDRVEAWMVRSWVEARIYPDVSEVKLGKTISKCWKGHFNSAKRWHKAFKEDNDKIIPCYLRE